MTVKLFSQLKNSDKHEVWIKRVNFWLLITLVFVLLIQVRSRSFIKESNWLVGETPKRDFCSMLATQMIRKNVSPILVEEGLYELISMDNYDALNFNGKEKLTGIWSNDKGCKVYLKDHLGTRSFDFILEDSEEHPYYWIVTKITEYELFEKEDV